MYLLIFFRSFIQYRVNIGSPEPKGLNLFNTVVMGCHNTGKSKFIHSLLRLQDDKEELHVVNTCSKIGDIYEYNETITDQLIPGISKAPASRARAINTGTVFILLFSVNDLESFIYADILRRDIVEKKGKDVPIMFVGMKSLQEPNTAFSGSYGLSLFADVVFDFPESYYFELSHSDEDVLTNIYNEIFLLKENYHASMKRQTNIIDMAINYLRKLVPGKSTICN